MLPNRKESDASRPPSAVPSTSGLSQSTTLSSNPAVPVLDGPSTHGVVFQNIHDLASKRISTLDYLRKLNDSNAYYFNVFNLNKNDISKLPYFEPKKLGRRAANLLLLGLSLPLVIEAPTSSPLEYLRILNALLAEFESYQQIHSPDGNASSSLSRARIPSMFKRATHSSSGAKGRRTSSATEIGLPMSTSVSEPADPKLAAGISSAPQVSFPASEQELLPGEEYTHLLTPSLPFEPDFFEVFACLGEILIDTYTKITTLVSSPSVCGPGVGELFAKADTKVRKLILSGMVKDFEEASRSGAKAELAGIGKIVVGGLL
ncbi:MAG: hypothetical protein M1814_000959 [Vezdaea aestivalis]|nr:MAG: hypothetical protein M1814_000959 [Vezdaea aestivalis]